jgi:hypothetical protein
VTAERRKVDQFGSWLYHILDGKPEAGGSD